MLPWVSIRDLWRRPSVLRRRIETATESWKAYDIVFANGLTDPRAATTELIDSNVEFPLSVIHATCATPGIRYLTLGTIFENFEEFASVNPYVRSKRLLSERLLAIPDLAESGRALHLQLHTIYGGPPKSHMFLGQMLQALERGAEFCMSSGEQLREYHHVDDIAGAILELLFRTWEDEPNPIELNSGAPIRLADLATAVFSAFDRLHLLKVGALDTTPGDNRVRVFPRSDTSVLPYYRDPIVGVLNYVRRHCATGIAMDVC